MRSRFIFAESVYFAPNVILVHFFWSFVVFLGYQLRHNAMDFASQGLHVCVMLFGMIVNLVVLD